MAKRPIRVRRASGRRCFLWALLGVMALGVLSCGGNPGSASQADPVHAVRGAITGLDATSILELGSVDLADETGVTWHFVARDHQRFTPSHLREHMVQGLPITVIYREIGDVLVILDIVD